MQTPQSPSGRAGGSGTLAGGLRASSKMFLLKSTKQISWTKLWGCAVLVQYISASKSLSAVSSPCVFVFVLVFAMTLLIHDVTLRTLFSVISQLQHWVKASLCHWQSRGWIRALCSLLHPQFPLTGQIIPVLGPFHHSWLLDFLNCVLYIAGRPQYALSLASQNTFILACLCSVWYYLDMLRWCNGDVLVLNTTVTIFKQIRWQLLIPGESSFPHFLKHFTVILNGVRKPTWLYMRAEDCKTPFFLCSVWEWSLVDWCQRWNCRFQVSTLEFKHCSMYLWRQHAVCHFHFLFSS